MTAYCDTSYLASLYAPDAHSAEAAHAARTSRAQKLVISSLCELELINALQLRVFRKELSAARIREALTAFQSDLLSSVYALQAISPAVFERAKQLSRKHSSGLGTRSLDVLHVAAALESRADILYTFDTAQKKLTAAVGLRSGPGK